MKRLLYSLILIAVSALSTQAQTTVKGILQDSLTHEGEPYATIRIYKGKEVKAQSTPTTMALTDLDGNFAATLKEQGTFTMLCSSTGKNTVARTFTANGEKEIDLGTLLTSDMESVMKAMDVVAQKPIVKMEADKVSYSVQDDVDSKSMSILDMLRKVPMVTVDGQDNITVNGQSSFKIYVDGKPNMMLSSNPSMILKAMPASMVSSIEVVTNPGAKYDAEGAGGILNINTAMAAGGGSNAAQSMNGYNGSISAEGGNRGGGAGATVAGQQGKFSYNANVHYSYNNNGTVTADMLRKQDNGVTTEYKMNTSNVVPFVMGNIGLGYEIDSLSQINASFGITRYNFKTNGDPTTRMFGGALGTGFGYSNHTLNKQGSTGFEGSLDYQRFFDAAHNGSISFVYQANITPATKESETTGFRMEGMGDSSMMPADRMSDGKENTQEHVFQSDVVNRLAPHSKLNYGVKYAFRRSTSDMDYFDVQSGNKTYNALLSTDYEQRSHIGAVYAESENTWEKLTAKAGLRYEHTWLEMMDNANNDKNFKKDYGNLVPSATLSYTVGMAQNLGLTYNMRISRPGISYLNPYVDRSEPTSLTYGNSDLDVEKTHNIGLTYSIYTPKVIISSSLRETLANGGIEQYSFMDNENRLNTTFGNIVDRRLTSLNIFAQWSMTKTTRIILNGAVNYNYLTSNELDATNKGWSGNAMLNVQQTLPKNWTVSVYAITRSKEHTLQGHRGGMNIGALTVSKSLLQDRLNLSLTAATGLSKGGKLHIDQYAEGKDFTSTTKISVPITRANLSVRWSFGNSKKKFATHESKVQNDYIEHKSSSESISNASNM
ncbi:MAG: TonB-dependent receptor [Bacteroidales bacterium]|nr:TonB-dependent receptor [Bacteroidales bacterium]